MRYSEASIARYIDHLAARKPAPGGGSAAGLVGAAGTALLEMVCNFTIGNDKYKNVEETVKKYLFGLTKTRENFIALVDDDVLAYSKIRDAFRTKDKKNIDKALKDGYYASDRACRLSKSTMEIALSLAEKGNPNLITDVGCGAELLRAAFNSAVFNCEINLKGLEGRVFADKERMNLNILKKKMDALYCKTIDKTWGRMG